ncbi:hypothetical protein PR048_024329 [Dryococelus australis]|uniref:Peptidase aspartic putative domain-containing protein n=1 Tax=Dryococelus australis TaxID=614101 RepID=A0ABQ9GNC0_9NEOP|nr:hypothetical protein PR048_024329 [Dryococelus australis]
MALYTDSVPTVKQFTVNPWKLSIRPKVKCPEGRYPLEQTRLLILKTITSFHYKVQLPLLFCTQSKESVNCSILFTCFIIVWTFCRNHHQRGFCSKTMHTWLRTVHPCQIVENVVQGTTYYFISRKCTTIYFLCCNFTNIVEHDRNPFASAAFISHGHSTQSLHVVGLLQSSKLHFGSMCSVHRATTSKSNLPVHRLAHTPLNSAMSVSMCIIMNVGNESPHYQIDAFVMSKISSKLLALTDHNFAIPVPVDMLLKAEIFAYLFSAYHVEGNIGQPIALETVLGWVLIGKVNIDTQPVSTICTEA